MRISILNSIILLSCPFSILALPVSPEPFTGPSRTLAGPSRTSTEPAEGRNAPSSSTSEIQEIVPEASPPRAQEHPSPPRAQEHPSPTRAQEHPSPPNQVLNRPPGAKRPVIQWLKKAKTTGNLRPSRAIQGRLDRMSIAKKEAWKKELEGLDLKVAQKFKADHELRTAAFTANEKHALGMFRMKNQQETSPSKAMQNNMAFREGQTKRKADFEKDLEDEKEKYRKDQEDEINSAHERAQGWIRTASRHLGTTKRPPTAEGQPPATQQLKSALMAGNLKSWSKASKFVGPLQAIRGWLDGLAKWNLRTWMKKREALRTRERNFQTRQDARTREFNAKRAKETAEFRKDNGNVLRYSAEMSGKNAVRFFNEQDKKEKKFLEKQKKRKDEFDEKQAKKVAKVDASYEKFQNRIRAIRQKTYFLRNLKKLGSFRKLGSLRRKDY